MMIIIWTKKFMLRPVAHCRSGCRWELKIEKLIIQVESKKV